MPPSGRWKLVRQRFGIAAPRVEVQTQIPWYWRWVGIAKVIPRFIRNYLYDVLARNRYKWFGKKEECWVPTADLKSRFLD